MPVDQGTKVFRSPELPNVARLFAGFALILATFFILNEDDIGPRVGVAVVALVLVLFAEFRAGRQGIYVGAQGLRARRIITETDLRWDEIERVELRRGWHADIHAFVILRDGRVVSARPLNGGPGILRAPVRRVEEQVEELNALVARNHNLR